MSSAESAVGLRPRLKLDGGKGRTLLVVASEHVNVAGLLFAASLRDKLTNPRIRKSAAKLRGTFAISAGQMSFSITFRPESIEVTGTTANKPRARISAPINELLSMLDASRSAINNVIAVFEGRLSIRGNPFAAASLLRIMRKRAPANS